MTADSKQSERDAESALSRWSRRKLEAREESQRGKPPTQEPADAAPAVDEKPAEAEKPVLTDADMPDIETLDENSDYSMFMSSGVSDKLRNRALRKLFGAPVFNIRDGLDEYDDDFTSFEKLGDIVTSDMKHQIEMEQQRLREALAEEQPAQAEAEVETGELETDDEAQPEGNEQTAARGSEKLARIDAPDAEENPEDDR